MGRLLRWYRVAASLETTLFAASWLPYTTRSPQVSHEASDNRTWAKESRRPKPVCPLPDQGACFEVHYLTWRESLDTWIETGEKPMRSLSSRGFRQSRVV